MVALELFLTINDGEEMVLTLETDSSASMVEATNVRLKFLRVTVPKKLVLAPKTKVLASRLGAKPSGKVTLPPSPSPPVKFAPRLAKNQLTP